MAMDPNSREYLIELGKMSPRRLNAIIMMVEHRTPKEEAGLCSETEEIYFDHLMAEAVEHEKEYGTWPAFQLWEIDYDDPALDIYPEGSMEEHLKERREKREKSGQA